MAKSKPPLFRGIARLETKEMASLAAEPDAGSSFIVALFDIPHDEVPAFYGRHVVNILVSSIYCNGMYLFY